MTVNNGLTALADETDPTVSSQPVGVSTPVLQTDVGGEEGARPSILAQEAPHTTSVLRPGLRPQSDPPPRSRQPITGDTSPELPLIGFAHPGMAPHGPSPGALTGTANLATKTM